MSQLRNADVHILFAQIGQNVQYVLYLLIYNDHRSDFDQFSRG